MSQVSLAIIGAVAISATFGAAQLASGGDLGGLNRQTNAAQPAINRLAKADRAVPARPLSAVSRTISFRLDGLADTSVLVRIPVAQLRQEARDRVPAPSSLRRPTESKSTVACEPPVSVLTEVARQLQPGRCVT